MGNGKTVGTEKTGEGTDQLHWPTQGIQASAAAHRLNTARGTIPWNN
jgi:hypothetical protein